MHQSLFVFDIETIPDTEIAPNLTGEEGDIAARREALSQYHLEITDGKNSFLRQPFHRVVAISFLEAEIKREGAHETYILKEVRSGGKKDASERELIQGFFNYLANQKARLVSFNGRTFDLPVLRYRAMKYGISAPWLYLSGDKWNNYTQRYSQDWHCDLLEVLSDYGAAARIRLNEICALLDLPGKMSTSGSDVMGLYDADKIDEIRNYCEHDVINTYLVYLHYQHHRGVITRNDFHDAEKNVLTFLENESSKRPHFKEFIDCWNYKEKSIT
jgi:hypothetical protein